jgi:hypothetical protein
LLKTVLQAHGSPSGTSCTTLYLSDAQVEAVARYIEEHEEELLEVHRQIEARKARGNPPEITAKLAKSRTKLQEWLTQHHEMKT